MWFFSESWSYSLEMQPLRFEIYWFAFHVQLPRVEFAASCITLNTATMCSLKLPLTFDITPNLKEPHVSALGLSLLPRSVSGGGGSFFEHQKPRL